MVVKDRLAELQSRAPQHSETVAIVHVNTNLQNDEEEEFFAEIDALKDQVEILTKKIEELKQKHNAIINPTVNQDEKFLRSQVEEATSEITALATRTNNGLKKIKVNLDKTKEDIEKNPGSNDGKALLRARQAHYNALTRRFKMTMDGYSKTQLDYRERLKNRLKKQLQIVGTDETFDDEMIDDMIENGNMAIFDEGFIKMQQNKQIHKVLINIKIY